MLLITAIGILALLIIGCTPEEEKKVREAIEQHRSQIDSEVQNTVKKANCQAFNGYICSGPDDCGVPYIDTIESYCCPVQCGTCNQSCDDNDKCTKDDCSKATGYECKHDTLKPCPNDGICEFQESHLDVNGKTSFGGKSIVLQNVDNSGRVLVDIEGVTEVVASTPKLINGVQVKVKEAFYAPDKAQRYAILIMGETLESSPDDCASKPDPMAT